MHAMRENVLESIPFMVGFNYAGTFGTVPCLSRKDERKHRCIWDPGPLTRGTRIAYQASPPGNS